MNKHVRHDPTYLYGAGAWWATCSCGWLSPLFRVQGGSLLAHGKHLVASAGSVPDGQETAQ